MAARDSMPAPKVVVFDLGKVLVDFDYSIAGRQISSRCRSPLDPAQFFSEHSPLILRYELGLVATSELFEQMRQLTEFLGTQEEFGRFFGDIFAEIPPMIEMHARLRQKGIPTFIFSNTNELAIEHIRKRFPFFAHFDGYVYSYEHGAMKPDAKLYEVVERETKCRGGEILYLDDRPENVAAGAARGWNAVLHESPEKSRAAVEKFGLLNGSCRAGD
jgi:glucose-1-phosphatase